MALKKYRAQVLPLRQIAAVSVAFVALFPAFTVRAESGSLMTRTGKDIGLSLSSYDYQEPGIMSLQGLKMGLDLRVVKVLQSDRFIRGDLRYAFGTVDYSSYDTGSASGEPDWYIEARGLIGKDLAVRESVISAYMGLGYRYLFNDGRGITSTGYGGYRRESNYFYLPLGLIHRRSLHGRAMLETELEYDQLLAGKQVSGLSDVGGGYSDVTNNQSSGYGLRLSVMYRKSSWIVGPFLTYWNIGESDAAVVYRYGVPDSLGVEPKNDTVELGVKASQQF